MTGHAEGTAAPVPASKDPVPVVFLHGIGGGARGWAPQVASFAAAGYRPVALDLPGYGARPAVEAMTFEALADDVEREITRLGLDRPVLVGHSMGGMIAQSMLRRQPDQYRAAVLIGTSPAFGNPQGDFQKQFVADRLAPLTAGHTIAEMAPAAVDGMMGPKPEAEGRRLATEIFAATPEATYRGAVLCLVTFDERANLPHIRVPVLCLVGEHDRNAPPPMMERMAARIPGAVYRCLPGVGHMPSLEAPDAFDAVVLEFLASALAPSRHLQRL
jgi:3-oxoadipate enol-lactonase